MEALLKVGSQRSRVCSRHSAGGISAIWKEQLLCRRCETEFLLCTVIRATAKAQKRRYKVDGCSVSILIRGQPSGAKCKQVRQERTFGIRRGPPLSVAQETEH